MKLEADPYYCSLCGKKRTVVLAGEVVAGEENLEVYVCEPCTLVLAEIWKSPGTRGVVPREREIVVGIVGVSARLEL